MKRVLAIFGIICLTLILYVESTSFTNTIYWESRHPQQSFFDIFSKGFNRNAYVITGWNSFVSFVPNVLHAINEIRLDFRRNISVLKTKMVKSEWGMYVSSLEPAYQDALKEVANYFDDLDLFKATDAQLLGEGTNLSDKAKEVLQNYYKLAKSHQLERRAIVTSGGYAQERSTLWDGLKIHPEYGGDDDALFTKASKFFAQCFIYFAIIFLIFLLIPVAFGSGKKKYFFKTIKSSRVYQLLKGCIHWSLWRFIVSGSIAVSVGFIFWGMLLSSHPNPHDRLILPFVGLLWGGIVGLLAYFILLIFSAKTYHAIREFLQWKHWKIAASVACMLVVCLLMTLGMLDGDAPKSSERFMPIIAVSVVTLIVGFISFAVLWLISFVVKKIMHLKKGFPSKKKEEKSSKNEELKQEKEKLQNQILSLEVAELKKKLADLEAKQEGKD